MFGTLAEALLIAAADEETLILTPNQRLYRTLLLSYHQQQESLTWCTPNILSWRAWLQKLWQEGELLSPQPLPQLLNSYQSAALWQRVIRETASTPSLLNLSSTTTLAEQAWNMTQDYPITLCANLFNYNYDSRVFLQWAQHFETTCSEQQWIDFSSIAQTLNSLIQSQHLTIPRRIVLAHFEQLTPTMQTLLNHCAAQGCEILRYQTTQPAGQCQRFAASNLEEELETMAAWASTLLTQKSSSIACIIPNLAQMRGQVEYHLQRYLPSESYHISLGKPFSHYAMIADGLTALACVTKEELSVTEVYGLLHSPYLGDTEQERYARAQLAQRLSRLGSTSVPRHSLFKLAADPAHACPELKKRLQAIEQLPQPVQALSAWAQYFSQCLQILGWPGDIIANSHAWQVHQRWYQLLDDFRSLDKIHPPQNVEQALHYLQKAAQTTIFQAQEANAPLIVLGVLESLGQRFDYQWVQGMTSNAWPASANPNPFIPLPQQLQHQLPDANAKLAMQHSTHLHQRLQQNAPEIIFSHAEYEGDIAILASALVSTHPTADKLNLKLQTLPSPIDGEMLSDEQAPALTGIKKIKGGTSVLRYQAACPFQAFAKLRLQVQAPPQYQLGYNAAERGTLVHLVLEKIWQRLVDQQSLLACSDEQRQAIVSECVNESLVGTHNTTQPTDLMLDVERERLTSLILHWLSIENQRPPFTVINTEHEISYTLNEIQITTRIDRIDQLPGGQKIIIDYKTGSTSTSSWQDDYPEQPQLPLYSLTDAAITAITFAQLKSGQQKFNGLADSDLSIPGINTVIDWQQQRQRWQESLATLLHEYCEGKASVTPLRGALTCQTCGLHSFCRI